MEYKPLFDVEKVKARLSELGREGVVKLIEQVHRELEPHRERLEKTRRITERDLDARFYCGSCYLVCYSNYST